MQCLLLPLTALVLLIVLAIFAADAKLLYLTIAGRFHIDSQLVAMHRHMRIRLALRSGASGAFWLCLAFLLACQLARLVMAA